MSSHRWRRGCRRGVAARARALACVCVCVWSGVVRARRGDGGSVGTGRAEGRVVETRRGGEAREECASCPSLEVATPIPKRDRRRDAFALIAGGHAASGARSTHSTWRVTAQPVGVELGVCATARFQFSRPPSIGGAGSTVQSHATIPSRRSAAFLCVRVGRGGRFASAVETRSQRQRRRRRRQWPARTVRGHGGGKGRTGRVQG